MNLFDRLVSQAIHHQADLAPLRVVVEKELLHLPVAVRVERAQYSS